MAKYNKKIVERICNLIAADSYTIAEICQEVGISESTYHAWKTTKSEFSESIKKAEYKFNDLIVAEAKKSLVKLIKGYTVQEKRTLTADTGKKDESGKPIVRVKEHGVTDKHYQPNTAAVIFALTNRDPDNWKNRQDNKVEAEIKAKGSVPVQEWLKKFGNKDKKE
jgi:hypothetical protein